MTHSSLTRPLTGAHRFAGVRVLGADDLPAAARLLARRPIQNLFVESRVRVGGLLPAGLGCPVWGYERDGELVGLCHVGANLVPVGADDEEVLSGFARFAGDRHSNSISGESGAVLGLWRQLSEKAPGQWANPREVRSRQPLMVIDSDPLVDSHPEVKIADLAAAVPYFSAAVAMYTEEVGVSPLEPSPNSYRNHVRNLMTLKHAFAVIRDDQVLFKADIGPTSAGRCQLQGVWLHPSLRGQRLAAPMVAAVVRYARLRYPTVSLYVNDYNRAALATYDRVGFRPIGEFATVLY